MLRSEVFVNNLRLWESCDKIRESLLAGERGLVMKCKFCLAEIGEEETVCPLCGKELTEAEEIEKTAEMEEKE